MGGKSTTEQLIESNLGQHLALSVAAHLARTQLVPEPLAVYDTQHLAEMVGTVALALARVAPLYVRDAGLGQPRELTSAELEGAAIRRGATVLTLRDGRTFSSVTMRRADLRQAMAILKAVGVVEIAPPPNPPQPPPSQEHDRPTKLRACVAEVEALLRPPVLPGHVERANRLLIRAARQASDGHVANLAMRLMSLVQESKDEDKMPDSVRAAVVGLRTAVDESLRGGE
jgi:hypothetical protein